MSSNTPGGKLAARGTIVELTMHDGREVAVLRDYDATEVRDGIVTIDFVKGQSRPAIRANEVATLLRDPHLANLLAPCKNMDERKAVLIPLAHQGYRVQDFLLDPEPEPEPVAPPQGSPPVSADIAEALDQLRARIDTVDGTLAMEIAALGRKVDTLAPTVISVAGHEPVTFEPGELVHESTAEVIESLEDGLHPYLTGEPGTGKSRLVYTAAKALGFSPDDIVIFPVSNMDQKGSLLGWTLPTTGEYVKGPLHHAFEGKLTALEELDAGNGAAMTAINIVLDAPYVTFPNGETLERPDRLFIIGCGNTVGKGGDMMFLRNQMDAATRNRWVFHHVTYDRNIERAVVTPILGEGAEAWLQHCWGIRERLEGERIVFSTRNIRHGALQLRRGRPIESIVESALLPGESADIVRKSGALNFGG